MRNSRGLRAVLAWPLVLTLCLSGCASHGSHTPSESAPPATTHEETGAVVAPSGSSTPVAADPALTSSVGLWNITVLSTDRDAATTIGQGNHPDNFPEVMTTLQITNTAGSVQNVELLEFQFGSLVGTQNGYNPWDDWCAPVDTDVYATSLLYLPGETRTVTVCVPVDPSDADSLSLWVSYSDGNDWVDGPEMRLPPAGATQRAQPQEDVAKLQARTLAAAGRSADAWGYQLAVSNVTAAQAVVGKSVVSLTLHADPVDSSLAPPGYVLSSGIGPSGNAYPTSICHTGEMWKTFDGTAWTQDLCMTVETADAGSLLFILEAVLMNEASVHLDARPT